MNADVDRWTDRDREAALVAMWQCVADSCVEHDLAHEHRALAALAELMQRQP